MKSYISVIILLYICLVSTASLASEDQREVGMVTGPSTSTAYHIGRDIATLAQRIGLDIDVKPSSGSLDNVARLESVENAGLAIVQSDVLTFLRTSQDPAHRQQSSKLRMILPLYDDEVHLFARANITSLADLEGQRVVVGTQVGGSDMTARNLLRALGVVPAEILYMPPELALDAVMQLDQADAMFYVAGAPITLFSQLDRLPIRIMDNFHFVPISAEFNNGHYIPTRLDQQHYPWLHNDVETLAVKAVLVSYDFSRELNEYHNMRCGQFFELTKAMREQFSFLLHNGHSKWREVDLEAQIGDWPRDSCSFFNN